MHQMIHDIVLIYCSNKSKCIYLFLLMVLKIIMLSEVRMTIGPSSVVIRGWML